MVYESASGKRVLRKAVHVQAEWALHSDDSQHAVAQVALHRGAIVDSDKPGNDDSQPSMAADKLALAESATAPTDHTFVSATCGPSELLYAPLQLHLAHRKRAQIVLCQHEAHMLRSSFNEHFRQVQKERQQCAEVLAERIHRISEIQRALGSSTRPEYMVEDEALRPETMLEVHDEDVQVPKWISPAER